MNPPRPLVLIILDGWGYAPPSNANAISLARKPNYDRLLAEFPNTLIHTSGRYVGLPAGQMGNSEVGHLNIGAGRVVYMDITKIDLMIENGEFFTNLALMKAMEAARTGERRLHLFGLVSDGGVHSHQNHLYSILKMAKQNGVHRVFVHCFMDGRDTLPTNGAGYLEQLQQKMREYGVGKFDAMAFGGAEGSRYTDPVQGVKDSYNKGVTDEFIIPFVVTDERGEPVGTIRDGDVCINFNFRADRARQITRCLARNSHFTSQDGRELDGAEDLDNVIPRSRTPKDLTYICMTQYDKHFTLPVISPPESLTNILANVMADRSMRNLRVAETEKYAHVTYFFNGGIEKPFPGEDRVLVPSPKVATYDLKPEMSAQGIADAVTQAIADNTFDVMVVNFANADMVGHSGKIPPTITAVETVDHCLGQVYSALRQRGGAMIVTADHGNAEQMIDPASGGPQTAHTTNPVPFIVCAEDAVTPANFKGDPRRFTLRADGALQDISPTMLGILGIPQPKEMTGHDLRILAEVKKV
jgi:2,3-bisphosphoglycerate-independent phosphoglycerate mutase